MSEEQRTYQCRIAANGNENELLSAYAALFGKAERTLFARLAAGGNLTDLKREFLPRFGITARQFNAVAATLKGKMSSIRERTAGLIKECEQRICRAEKVLAKTTDPARRHHKKRRLETLKTRLSKLTCDLDAGKVRFVFASGPGNSSGNNSAFLPTDMPPLTFGVRTGRIRGKASFS